MDWQQYISSDRGVLGGKPIIKGTRIGVDLVLGRLADGWTQEQLLASYPTLRPEHIRAIHAFVNACLLDGLLIYDPQRKAG